MLGHWTKSLFTEASIVDQVGPGTPARSLPLWYPNCCGKAPQGSHVILPQRVPYGVSQLQAGTHGRPAGGVEGFAKDSYRVLSAPLAQNCSQKELGRQCLLFLPLSSL